jgi:hypothetical protein
VGDALIIKYVLRVPLVHAVVLKRTSGAGFVVPPVTLKISLFAPEALLGISAIIR